jgi:hypothetical protein
LYRINFIYCHVFKIYICNEIAVNRNDEKIAEKFVDWEYHYIHIVDYSINLNFKLAENKVNILQFASSQLEIDLRTGPRELMVHCLLCRISDAFALNLVNI